MKPRRIYEQLCQCTRCTCINMCTYIYIYIYIYLPVCVYIATYMHACMLACLLACMPAFASLTVRVYVHVFAVHVCVLFCIYAEAPSRKESSDERIPGLAHGEGVHGLFKCLRFDVQNRVCLGSLGSFVALAWVGVAPVAPVAVSEL